MRFLNVVMSNRHEAARQGEICQELALRKHCGLSGDLPYNVRINEQMSNALRIAKQMKE